MTAKINGFKLTLVIIITHIKKQKEDFKSKI